MPTASHLDVSLCKVIPAALGSCMTLRAKHALAGDLNRFLSYRDLLAVRGIKQPVAINQTSSMSEKNGESAPPTRREVLLQPNRRTAGTYHTPPVRHLSPRIDVRVQGHRSLKQAIQPFSSFKAPDSAPR
jgi:hypothetical protein